MSESSKTRLETFSNVGIIVVSILIVYSFASRFLQSPQVTSCPTVNPVAKRVGKGDLISLPGLDLTKKSKNVILVVSKKCHFCIESAAYYARLTKTLKVHPDIDVALAIPESKEEAIEFLKENSINIEKIVQVTPDDLGVKGTPTILFVDSTNRIREIWRGKLSPDSEDEVINKIVGS